MSETSGIDHTDVTRLASDNQWQNLSNYDDFISAAKTLYGELATASEEIGDGFAILDNKDKLVGVPFIILDWRFLEGDFTDPSTGKKSFYVSARVAAKMDGGHTVKYRVNDGGAGICKQLLDFQQRTGVVGGLIVNGGLTRSDYTNEYGDASTYYLNTSA